MSAKDMFYAEGKEFSNAEERAFQREELVYNAAEDILLVLEDLDISKKELARRLGKSKSYVTQVLSGARNMTLGSLSDICFSLGVKPKINISINCFHEQSEMIKSFAWQNELITKEIERKVCYQTPKKAPKKIMACEDLSAWKSIKLMEAAA